MKAIPQATKEAIIKKALNQPGANLKMLARENNIGYSTLTKLLTKYRSGAFTQLIQNNKCKVTKSREEQLNHLLATAHLDATAIGVYCREHGLYALQLTEWKKNMVTEIDETKYQNLLNEIKSLRTENKELKQDIHRKDRALAETTALLVLKKKADVIWGESEVD